MPTSFVVRRIVAWTVRGAVIVVLVPAASAGQVAVPAFDRLGSRLTAGDEIGVTDGQGQRVRGRVVSFDATALVLDAGGRHHEFHEEDVSRVEKFFKDSGWDGAAYGAAIGVAGLYGATYVGDREMATDPEGLPAVVVTGAVGGALVGFIVDKLHRGRRTIYVRSQAGGRARLTAGPVVTPHAKGVSLSYVF